MGSSSTRKARLKKAKGKPGGKPKPAERIPFQQEVSKCASVEKRLALVTQANVTIKKGFRAVFTIATYACSAHGGGVHPLSVVATNENHADTARGDIEVIIQRMREVANDLELQLAGMARPPAAPFN